MFSAFEGYNILGAQGKIGGCVVHSGIFKRRQVIRIPRDSHLGFACNLALRSCTESLVFRCVGRQLHDVIGRYVRLKDGCR